MKIIQRTILFFLLFISYQVSGQTWKDHLDSAKLFQDQKNNDKAIGYYLKANDLLNEHLLEKKSINEAFTLTQKIMRNKYKANPHKWAGIVLIQ